MSIAREMAIKQIQNACNQLTIVIENAISIGLDVEINKQTNDQTGKIIFVPEIDKKTMTKKAMIEWLTQCAIYFENRDWRGEDMGFWSNIYNAKNAREIAEYLKNTGDSDVP